MKICTTCDGKGMTRESATVVKQVSPKVWVTKSLGSGCLTCGGRGIIGKRRVWPGMTKHNTLTDHYPQHIIDAVNEEVTK